MLYIVDCVADRVWLAVPQATEWQRIGNQINTAFIVARADQRKEPQVVRRKQCARKAQDIRCLHETPT